MQIKLLNTIKQYDTSFFCWCMDLEIRPTLTRASRLVSHTADGYYYVAILLGLYLYSAEIPSAFYYYGRPGYLGRTNLLLRPKARSKARPPCVQHWRL